MKEIPLTQGKTAIVDDDMYEYLSQFRWYFTGAYAASKSVILSGGGHGAPKIYMHRLIMRTPKGLEVDHIDGNGLHNWRSNLRNCTHAQNTVNRPMNLDKSGFKGVYWHKRNQCWQAQIQKNKAIFWLGNFDDPEAAARAYDEKAKELFGEFARLNFEN